MILYLSLFAAFSGFAYWCFRLETRLSRLEKEIASNGVRQENPKFLKEWSRKGASKTIPVLAQTVELMDEREKTELKEKGGIDRMESTSVDLSGPQNASSIVGPSSLDKKNQRAREKNLRPSSPEDSDLPIRRDRFEEIRFEDVLESTEKKNPKK